MYSETKIAIPIFQRNKEDILKVANDCIIKGADILELRIDGMDNPNPKSPLSVFHAHIASAFA